MSTYVNIPQSYSGSAITALTGDVTGTGPGSTAATIGAGKVTLAMQSNVATRTWAGRMTAATGVPETITFEPHLTAQGLVAETGPRNERVVSSALVTGTVYYTSVPLYAGQVVANISIAITVISVSATLAKVGLYDKTGARLALSATQHTAWNTTPAMYTVALIAPYTVTTSDLYYVAVVSVGGTAPAAVSMNPTASTLSITSTAIGAGVVPFGVQTGQSDLPSPGTVSGNVTTAISYWMGLS